MNELEAKIQSYREKIAALQAAIDNEDAEDVFGGIAIVQMSNEIRDYQQRIARLESRIAGTAEQGPADEQLRCAAYVLSGAYDTD